MLNLGLGLLPDVDYWQSPDLRKTDPGARCASWSLGPWGRVLRPLARPDTGHTGTLNSNNCDCLIFLTIKQILFTEAYQRLMQMRNPTQIVPIRRFLLREDSK